MKPGRKFLFSLLIIYLAAHSGNCQMSGQVSFFSFESTSDLWVASPGENNRVKKLRLSQERFLEGNQSLEIQMNFPGEATVEKSFYRDLTRYRYLIFNIYAAQIPDDLKLVIFLQDSEWLWYQTPLITLQKNRWNKLTLNVQPDSTMWENINHSQPWSTKTASSIRKIGLKVFCNTAGDATLWVDEISGQLACFPEVAISRTQVPVYEKLEITFHLPENYSNPFSPEEVNVEGYFSTPDGKEIVVPGFYYQEYEAGLSDGQEILAPSGYPCWKVRFTPEKSGQYSCRIRVRDKSGEKESQKISFLAVESQKPGFVRISQIDRRYFQFSNGQWFYPVGLNIRSPTDTRYAALRRRPMEPDSGTFYYENIFKQMKESGQNFAEIWLANWFAALEWIENRPGYRGIGFYNLRHAWKLDRILQLAEANSIYLQIVIINHGQLSTYCDEEWHYHPYNEKNGGFLKSPEDFFTDQQAEKLTRQKLRYIVARWGYSPNIFGWILLNEINLTGSNRDFYLKPVAAAWYRKMASYLKEIDPYRHLISAHYTILVDNDLLRSPEIDYVVTNAYYDVGRNSLVGMLENIYQFNSKFEKPNFVSEFGGTPWGASEKNLIRDLVAGLWASFHLPLAGAPAFWWHRLVQELNLYPFYRVLTTYAADFDRVKSDFQVQPVVTPPGLKALALGNSSAASVWIYDLAVMQKIQDFTFPEWSKVKISLPNKKPGRYQVEFWSMEKGLLETTGVQNEGTDLTLQLPPFRHWIAVKVKAQS